MDSFTYQWLKHKTTQLDSVSGRDESYRAFCEKTGWRPEDLTGKLVLDAGCGVGRYTEITSRAGALVTAIDVSALSVQTARENVPRANIHWLSIFDLPETGWQFDYVFSIGVLHHTPDARRAFRCLAETVKPGGKLAVWVYSNEGLRQRVYNTVSGVYRQVTTRLPLRVVYALSHLAVPVYWLQQAPVISAIARTVAPCSNHPCAEWRVLDTFDWYAPRYQSKHTYAEVESWFKESGFGSIERLPFPVAVRGTKVA